VCVCVCVCVYMYVCCVYILCIICICTHTHTHTHTHIQRIWIKPAVGNAVRAEAQLLYYHYHLLLLLLLLFCMCVCVCLRTHTQTHTHTHINIHIHIHINAVGIAGSWRKRSSSRYGPDQAPRPSTLKTCPRTIKLQRHGPDQAPGPSTPKHPSPLSSQAQTWTRRCGASTRRIARHAFRRYVSLTSRGGREGGGNGRGGEALSLKVHP